MLNRVILKKNKKRKKKKNGKLTILNNSVALICLKESLILSDEDSP